ncbi:MAG TPA: phosphatase PAP2 family protein [Candidatus Saccharimonadales bacterium]|jgi:membrane-associated phospholipid phosphatase
MYTNRSAHTKQTKKESAYPPIAYVVGMVVGILLLVPTAIAAHTHQLNGLQARIFYDFDNVNLASGYTTAARWLSEGLGAAYPIAACVLVPALFKRYRLAWRFLFTAGGATAVFYVIKKIINEPRPIAMLHGNLHQRVVETGPGFPSGHETAATALALTLWIILPTKWRWLSILWILVVAASRLYLGVHTPGDVIGGFAIGLMAVCFVKLLPLKIARLLRLDEETLLLNDSC